MYFLSVGLTFNYVGVVSFRSLRLGSCFSPLDAFMEIIKKIGASPVLYQMQPHDAFGEVSYQAGWCFFWVVTDATT